MTLVERPRMPRNPPEVTTAVEEQLEVLCPGRCSGKTYHRVLARAERNESNEEMWWSAEFDIIECNGCGTISFRRKSQSSEDWDYDEDGNMAPTFQEELFPGRIEGGKGMPDAYLLPEKVANVYRETREALAAKLRVLAGVGIRALVEAVCAEQNASGPNLEKRIDDLVTKGVLSEAAAEFLHSTRLVGNEAAHEVEPQSDDILVAAMGVAEYLLLHMYLMERRIRHLPRRVRRPAKAAASPAPGASGPGPNAPSPQPTVAPLLAPAPGTAPPSDATSKS